MSTLRLAGRILRGGGARGALRLLLMVVGVAIGVTAFLFVASMPGVLQHRGDLSGLREPAYASDNVAPMFRYSIVDGLWDNARFTRILVADIKPGAPVPPGLAMLPTPGQTIVSPAAARLRADNPVFAQLLPGTVAGDIAPVGLIDPHELYAYVGVTAQQLGDSSPGSAWGGDPDQTMIHQFSGVALELAVLVLGPTIIYLLVCAGLSASTRTRRYSALRLVGAGRSTILKIAAVEASVSGALGGLAGVGLYTLTNRSIGPSGVVGFAWYPAISALTAAGTVAAIVVIILASAAVGALGTSRALSKPLAGRFDVAERPARWWFAVPLVLGLGLLAMPLVIDTRPDSAGGSYAQANNTVATILVVGITLCSLGLLFALRPLLVLVARAFGNARLPLAVRLAARRVELEPGGTVRLISGLVLLVQVAGVGAGVLHLVEISAMPVGASTSASLPARELPAASRTAVFDVPADHRWIIDNSVTTPPGPDFRPSGSDLSGFIQAIGVPLIVATCAEADHFVGVHLSDCANGGIYRLTDTRADPQQVPTLPAGYQLHYLDGDGRPVSLATPAQEITYQGVEGPGLPQILITRQQPPLGISPNAIMCFTLSSNANSIDTFLSHISAVAPNATPTVNNLDLDLLETYRTQHGTIEFGVVLGFILGMLAFAIAMIDRTVERRRQVAALAVLGFTARTLRSVQSLQYIGSVGVALLAAVLIAHIVGNAFLRLDNLQHGWFYGTITASVPLAGIGIVVAAAAGMFITGSHPQAEDLRRE